MVVDEGEAAAEVDRIERDGEVGPPRKRLVGVAHVRIGPEVLVRVRVRVRPGSGLRSEP